jgi:plasmid stabilization system protein ParE
VIYRVRRHVDVERDILDLAVWLAKDSRETAFRFLNAVEDSIRSLHSIPLAGSLKLLRDRRLANVRSWAVSGFPNHIILYEVRDAEVVVFAVVHGARRYGRLLRSRAKE